MCSHLLFSSLQFLQITPMHPSMLFPPLLFSQKRQVLSSFVCQQSSACVQSGECDVSVAALGPWVMEQRANLSVWPPGHPSTSSDPISVSRFANEKLAGTLRQPLKMEDLPARRTWLLCSFLTLKYEFHVCVCKTACFKQ